MTTHPGFFIFKWDLHITALLAFSSQGHAQRISFPNQDSKHSSPRMFNEGRRENKALAAAEPPARLSCLSGRISRALCVVGAEQHVLLIKWRMTLLSLLSSPVPFALPACLGSCDLILFGPSLKSNHQIRFYSTCGV